ncbi:excinuclease ABC subunit UvrA [Tautonia rosea]|uniref:excinuclease ABC subunit UvrA n=1 Tax=Tautonia rosea TaxID=2728037 RepID=UPI001475B22E|nr:excinuclease ABC subunit UvrA [Tautonia rosea]
MASSDIVIRGAREHNLRDISLQLPRGALICFTGVSGSGKSSMAFDTLYAEGQRRYVESLSSYARQFLGQLPKPDVDRIDGLSPSIAIQQKTGGRNPRSTVGTITEIHDHLRVLFARVGRQHCPSCGQLVSAQTREQIVAQILDQPVGTAITLLAPMIRGQKGEHRDLFADLSRAGYVRARVDGRVIALSDPPALDRQVKHEIEVVIDRIKLGPSVRSRLAEAVESALKLGGETVIVAIEGRPDLILSSRYACVPCGIGFDAPSPQLFSFNSPQGMCPSCDGLGIRHDFAADLLVPDLTLSVWEGAIAPLGPVRKLGKWKRHLFEGFASNLEADEGGPKKGTLLRSPWEELAPEHQQAWLYGTGDRVIVYRWKNRSRHWSHPGTWKGIANELLEKYQHAKGGPHRAGLEPYMRSMTCPDCEGARLNPRARAVRVGDRSLSELEAMDLGTLSRWFERLSGAGNPELPSDPEPLTPRSLTIAEELLKEIRGRLRFLTDVGLDYLTLDRSAPTLSGGEAQRIRLASQVGAGLVGVLYILDEPSIGLHPRDNDRLIATLQRLRDIGNTVVVVEHDEDTMRAADTIVDFGPGPGIKGGEVIAQGDLATISRNPKSLTGQYLSGRKSITVPDRRRGPAEKVLRIVGARQNNLKTIDVSIPVGRFVCVTGVSGSGKSSLIGDILRETLARDLNGAKTEPGLHDRIEGVELFDKIIDIDQSPIGRTPRSNPATYIKLFDEIRDLFTKLPDSKTRGYKPGRFSFNVPGGRCEACQGNGSNKLEMDFLADVWVTCPVCEGKRFNRETLHCRFKGKSISDVLEMDVQEALEHFANVPKIGAMLKTLHDVGLDYLKLGQPSPTLSGGEAQRIKLARELVRKGTGKTLYVLDEPTTGLHFEDIRRLLDVLHGFVEQGNTVVVIEHNLDVIKTADWILDLGPEGGAGGGQIVAEGTPEEVARVRESHTGKALARILRPDSGGRLPSTNGNARKKSGHARSTRELSTITIEGASQHNLKEITVRIPRNQMTVCSGPSGSGKSSLAMDTLYAEGQRRYVESLSSYARQFLAPLQKPKVERVTGLSPAISIEQKTTSKSPRSTVGTVTEIHDYLRILFARLGHMYCPSCGIPVGTQTSDEIVEKILHHPEGTRIFVMAPLHRNEGDDYETLWNDLRGSGFVRVRVDGVSHSLDAPPQLNRRESHSVEVVVDRGIVRRSTRARLADAVEAALDLGRGVIHIAKVLDDSDESRWPIRRFSQHRSCDGCGRSFEELSPHHFSFNSSLGWCPSCEGLGVQLGADPAALIPDGRKSLRGGTVAVWPAFEENPMFGRMIASLADRQGIDLETPFDDLEARHRRMILFGTGATWFEVPAEKDQPGFRFQYKGLFPSLEEAGRLSYLYRAKLRGMVAETSCSTCMGGRLRDDAAAVRFKNFTIDQISQWPLGRALSFFQRIKLSADERHIAGDLIREIRDRLKFLVDVGLEYLSLARSTPTLSGGESQRIRLASQIGSGLTGVLYVLDEPTIGLHPRDNTRLLRALQHLRNLGNTLVLVEHDREVIEAADHLLDFGPGSGDLGGRITAYGAPTKVRNASKSLTGRYLSGRASIPVPSNRRNTEGAALVIRNARHHNLKEIDVAFPIGVVTAVTGVSGSGKSSLVEDILMKACAQHLHRSQVVPGLHDEIEGIEIIDKMIGVDQTPIGGTPNSTPATYTGVFDLIREWFAKMPESKIRGYGPGRFSFNVPGGRCEACEGAGQTRIEMHFLPDVWVPCESCGGARFTGETLAVTYRGKSIADVLAMKVDAALDLFAAVPKIRRVLQTLQDVGLGYVALGQSAPTLSGGEAQRIKLAAELARPQTGRTLYVLDEPTTGLHSDDVRKLLDVIHRLADLGNTVVIIEHHLDVIKTADWVIDLGPEAGERGGTVVAVGPPEVIAASPQSLTGGVLKPVLDAGPLAPRKGYDPVAEARKELADARRVAETIGEVEAIATPWESDGRRWHTRDRLTRTGKPARWDGRILEFIVDRLAKLGSFGEPDWSKRTLVRVSVPNASRTTPPFFEASTGQEWVVTLRFRVPMRQSQNLDRIQKDLGLKPFDSLETPVVCDAPRVSAGFAGAGFREVVIMAHSAEELCTVAFESFIDRMANGFLGQSMTDEWGDAKARMASLVTGSDRK